MTTKKKAPKRNSTRRPVQSAPGVTAPAPAAAGSGFDWSGVRDAWVREALASGQSPEGWENMAFKRNPLADLEYVAGALKALEGERKALLERRDRAVARARAYGGPEGGGASWEAIARAAGLTHPALVQRHGKWKGDL